MVTLPITLPEQALAALCEDYQVSRLAVYGSVISDHFSPESDIDILIEFLPGCKPSLMGLGKLQMALSKLLGRRVDLKTPEFISEHFRQAVINSSATIYEHT